MLKGCKCGFEMALRFGVGCGDEIGQRAPFNWEHSETALEGKMGPFWFKCSVYQLELGLEQIPKKP